MKLKILEEGFAICRLRDYREIDLTDKFCFVGKTDEELSLLCLEAKIPNSAYEVSTGWRGLRIEGVLDFSLTGILAKLSQVLARAEIGIFAVSTYNTDYVFIKQENLDKAVLALRKEGYDI
jgi:hypothetical protein